MPGTDTTVPAGQSVSVNQQLPTWYDELANQFGNAVSGNINEVGQLGQNWYNQPLVAGLDPLQQQAYAGAAASQGVGSGQYQTGVDTSNLGTNYLQGAGLSASQMASGLGAGQQGLDTAGNLYNQAQGQAGNALQGLGTGMEGLANAQNTAGAAGAPMSQMTQGLGQAAGQYNQAAGQFGQQANTANNITAGLTQGQQNWNQGTGMMQQGAQQANQAAQYDPNQMQQFMNPYTQGVAQDMARLSQQNLMEKVLPGVNATFTGAGQFGGSRNAEFTNRAMRDQEQALASAQGQMLAGAQNSAQQQYSDWANRGITAAQNQGQMGQGIAGIGTSAASTTGNLYGQQAGAQGQAGQNQQALGTSMASTPASIYGQQAGLMNQQAGTQAGIAAQQAQLPANIYNQYASQLAGLGQNQTALGQANAQMPASIYGAQAGALQSAGQGLGSLGTTQAQLGQLGQTMNANDLSMLNTYGGINQANQQAGLTAGYNDWLQQQQLPTQQLGALSQMVPQFASLYKPNTTTTAASTAPQNSTIDMLLAALGGAASGATGSK